MQIRIVHRRIDPEKPYLRAPPETSPGVVALFSAINLIALYRDENN